MGRILFGLAIAITGAMMTFFYEKTFRMFGANAWAEKHLGIGESRLFYQILGALLAFLGMAIMFNVGESIVVGFLGKIFGGLNR